MITLRKTKRFVDRVAFFIFRLRQHLWYSLNFSDLRASEHRLREIAHSIDKAKKLKTYDPKRVASRIQAIDTILASSEDLSEENLLFLNKLGLVTSGSVPQTKVPIGLPSVRHYTSEPVELAELENSIKEASHYPKSCSRESARIVQFKSCKDEAAGCFSGLTAFEAENFELFAVVVDLTAYDQRSELFAPYIDGSIFATAFCSALWRCGVGTCMLNWSSQSKIQESSLRALAKLRRSDLIIMGITAGKPAYVPCHAPRKALNQILVRV